MYPVMLDLTNRSVLVVGGGKIATRKVAGLLASSAKVTVISPFLAAGISHNEVNWLKRKYRSMDVKGYALVFACTDDGQINEWVVSECQSWQLVNNTSQKEQSTFYNMATIRDEAILYGISTLGENPMLAKKSMEELKQWLESRGKSHK